MLQTFAASHPLATEQLKQRRSTVVVDTTLFISASTLTRRFPKLSLVVAVLLLYVKTWLTEFESYRCRDSSYRNGAPMHADFHFGLIICMFFLTFLEPLIHDSKYGDKRHNNNAICLVNLNKRAKLILPNLLVD